MRAVVLLVAVLLLAGCSGSDEKDPVARATSLAGLDPGAMALVRVGFCDLVPASAVRKALDGKSTDEQEWGNGDEPPLDGAESDLTHEFGCAWARAGHAARAWVFARPVAAAFGRQVVAEARARKGCTTKRAATFGKPGMRQRCTLGNSRIRVRYAGLFGDTWLTCEVTGPERTPVVAARADAWCVAIANALDKNG